VTLSSPRWRAAALFVVCFAVYNANLRTIESYDSLAASSLPLQIWWGHGLDLGRLSSLQPAIRYSVIRSRTGQWISAYPIVTPLLVAPLYAPLRLVPACDPEHMTDEVRLLSEKLAASLIAALSVVVVFLTLRRLTGEAAALGLALVYAFATATWTIASQALWQHGPAELFLAAALYLLLAPRPAGWRAAALGLLCGLLAANRPHDVFFAAAIAAIVVWRSRRAAWPLLVTASAVAAALLAYNLHYFGSLAGGYAQIAVSGGRLPELIHWPDPEEIAVLLVSNRGLLVFCPFFLALGAVRGSRLTVAAGERWLLAGAVAALLVFVSCFPGASGGVCYGPRYLTDALPLLCLLLADAWERLRRPARIVFVAGVAWAVGLQIVGAWYYPAGDSGPNNRRLWSVAGSAPVEAWRHGPLSPFYLVLLAPGKVSDPSLPPAGQQGTVRWLAAPPPASWQAAATLPLDVAVTNGSPARWTSLGRNYGRWPVRLLVEWQPLAGPAARQPEASSDYWLRWRLMPHQTVERRLAVTAPPLPGTYRLVVEPAQSNASQWTRFSQAGAVAAVATVTVTPAPAAARRAP
jgi:hypothetical protein